MWATGVGVATIRMQRAAVGVGETTAGDISQRTGKAESQSCVRAPACEAVTVHTSLGELHGFTSMDDAPLTFAALEARIVAIPDGPSAELVTPRIMVWMNVVGTFGVLLALMPSLLIHLMDPRMWMLRMAQVGLVIAVLGLGPSTLRNGWVVAKNLWQWRPGLVAQMDHDLGHFRDIIRWLAGYPRVDLNALLRFTQAAQQRLGSKLVLLAGSVDRLGAIPLFAALMVLAGNIGDLTDIPLWQAILGMFLALTWLVASIGAHMRLRMQLYEWLLSDAVGQHAEPAAGSGRTRITDG